MIVVSVAISDTHMATQGAFTHIFADVKFIRYQFDAPDAHFDKLCYYPFRIIQSISMVKGWSRGG
jgi:hypothetical protein